MATRIDEILGANQTIRDAAAACRRSGLPPVECAPHQCGKFPETSALNMAITLVSTWPCELSKNTLQGALSACKINNDSAYSPADIENAVAKTLGLTQLDFMTVKTRNVVGGRDIGLFQGDLTKLTSAETVDLLVVSCLPGDYTPTEGSLIGALDKIGVSVAQLAQNKAADDLLQSSCWISQPIQNQPFGAILCFESTGTAAPGAIPGIFSAIQNFYPTPQFPLQVASPLVSTGSAGASSSDILTALFKACNATMRSYALNDFEIGIFSSDLAPSMQQLFTQLKQQVGG